MSWKSILVLSMASALAWGADEKRGPEPADDAAACGTNVAVEVVAVSPFHAEIAKEHPKLATSAALRALPWRAAEPDIELGGNLFRTDEIKFGQSRQSTLVVQIRPNGQMAFEMVISAEDDFAGIEAAVYEFANFTVDGQIKNKEVINTKRVLRLYDVTDTDLKASDTACANGRGLFTERLYKRLLGTTPEVALAQTKPHAGAEHLPAAVDANTHFGTLLAKLLGREAVGEKLNYFASANSIGTAWSMAANGAVGDTLKQMMSVFGTKLSEGDLLNGMGALGQALRTQTGGAVHTANALYGSNRVPLNPAFVKLLQEVAGAEVDTLKFGDASAAAAMNAFVKKNTDGMIPSVIEQTDAADLLYIINAIVLKVKWEEKFDKARTRDQQFHSVDGVKTVKMMNRVGQFRRFSNDVVDGMTLATEGGIIAVDFYLPKERLIDDRIADLLDLQQLRQWGTQFGKATKLDVSMPRLKLKYKKNLIPAMKALGVEMPFVRNAAKFDRFANEPSFISLFLHDAVLELEEEGAKAAAVTVIGAMRSLAVEVVPSLVFDRPYIIAFRNISTGEILFHGVVANP